MIEFLGMIFSMLGAYFMSRSTIKYPKTMLFSGIAFLISNILMILLAISEGMIPLFIQMVLFFLSSMLIILGNVEDKERAKKIFGVVIMTTIIIGSLINSKEFVFVTIQKNEILAAFMAITGSFLLKSKNEDIKIYSFILFFVADILYAWIGFSKELYFFMIQAIFFWYTSIRGIYNSLETKKALS